MTGGFTYKKQTNVTQNKQVKTRDIKARNALMMWFLSIRKISTATNNKHILETTDIGFEA